MIAILPFNDPLPSPSLPAEELLTSLERFQRMKGLLKSPLRVPHITVEELDDEALDEVCFYEALMWGGVETIDSQDSIPSAATMLLECSPIQELRERTAWDDRFLVRLAVTLMGLFAVGVAAFAAFVLPHLPWIGPRIQRFFAAVWTTVGL